MEASFESRGKERPARKTLLAVACLAVMGGAALCVYYLHFATDTAQGDADDVEIVAAGPAGLAGSGTTVSTVDLESEDESHVRSVFHEKIADPHQKIEDPTGAMRAFYRALGTLESGGDSRNVVRVLHYGDSILTTDELSGRVREILQTRFGDGGHGFILLGKPWRWYKHLNVEHGARGKWRSRVLTSDPVSDGLYGLGGVAFEAQRGSHGRAWAGTVDEGSRVSVFDISYLEQPHGGSFDLSLDGKKLETISTDAVEKRTVHKTVDVRGGKGKIGVEFNNDGVLRLFGVVMESGDRGVVYDSLAINGARASVLGRYDEEHWAKELKRRDPSLIVLMFGANEGANRFLVLREYRVHLARLIRTMRAALPDTSFLVVGPLDQAKKNAGGTFDSWKMPRKLSKAQREVSLAEGCAFFDTWNAMGGKGSMGRWYRKGLGGGDFIHPTEHGARKIGNWLAEALLYGYQTFERWP